MQSSSTLPRPSEWPTPKTGKIIVALVFVVLLGVAAVPVGFGFMAIGHPGGLRYAIVFSVMMFLAATFGYFSQLRTRHRNANIAIVNTDDGPATEIRGSMLVLSLLFGMFGCLAVFFGMAAVDYFRSGPEVSVKQIPAGLCALVALYFGSYLILISVGLVRRGRVVLSARGIRHRGWSFLSFLPWSAFAGGKASLFRGAPYVLAIAYANAPWERKQYASLWKVDKLPPKPMIALNCTAFAVDRNLLYYFVMFYLNNPAARAELGTERSLQRARSGELL